MNIGKMVGAMAVIAAVVAVAIIPTTTAQAQGRRTVIVTNNGHSNYCYPAPAYVAPAYAAPAYVAPVYKEYIPIAVPTAYPVVAVPVYSYVNAPGFSFGSVMQGQQQAVATDNEKVADLVVEKLKRQGLIGPNQGIVSPPDNGGPPAVKPNQAVAPSVIPKVDTTGFAAKAEALIGAKCASCHSGTAKAGAGIVFFDEAKKLVKMGAEDRIQIYDSIYEGRMPKNGTPFTDQEVEWVRVWMRQK